MKEVIVVTSAGSGVGQTTVTVNLGAQLAREGNKVCVIDFSKGFNTVDVMTGLWDKLIYDVMDVLNEEAPLSKALLKDKRFECFQILPASTLENKSFTLESFNKLIVESHQSHFDHVLMDIPIDVIQMNTHLLSVVDRVIVVSNPSDIQLDNTNKVIRFLQKEISYVDIVLNRMEPIVGERNLMATNNINMPANMLGIVEEDLNANPSIPDNLLVLQSSKLEKNFKQIINQLENGNTNKIDMFSNNIKQIKGYLNSIQWEFEEDDEHSVYIPNQFKMIIEELETEEKQKVILISCSSYNVHISREIQKLKVLELLNEMNSTTYFGKAVILDDGEIAVAHFIPVDNGVPSQHDFIRILYGIDSLATEVQSEIIRLVVNPSW